MAEKVWKILLLTNRDSDNVGDQVIEACDISLISAVMKNLNIEDGRYIINSQVAGIVSKRYLETRSERLYKKAEAIIKDSDIIIFGGADGHGEGGCLRSGRDPAVYLTDPSPLQQFI